jgi:penicillin-binding protein-related factor A (putative recombinase)
MTAMRGKIAEGAVKKVLSAITRQDFAWYRLPDAHAGSRQPTLADFLLVNQGMPILLEVKETAHDFRLPVGNFKLENRARMRIFQLAGVKCSILVYHSGTRVWRCTRLDYFGTQDTGSWDLRNTSELTLKEALELCLQ